MGYFKTVGGVTTPFLQKSYFYKVNGKTVSRAEYLAYTNKPGGDEKGKQTNDPDVYGRKCGGSVASPKVCENKDN